MSYPFPDNTTNIAVIFFVIECDSSNPHDCTSQSYSSTVKSQSSKVRKPQQFSKKATVEQ
jgi:hypothetical protein